MYKNATQNERLIKTDEVAWIVVDAIIIFLTLAGNVLTICAIKLCKKISGLLANKYILSLAVSDLMVGLTIPYHLAFTIGSTLHLQKTTCILRFVLIILVCSSSIYNLLAIAADRYLAIVMPFYYSRYMCKLIVWGIIVGGWCVSFAVATAPIYWNVWTEGSRCIISKVLPVNYALFIITPMFLSIWFAMSLLYLRIWREAVGNVKRLKTQCLQQKHKKILKENKSVQMVLLILGCFSLCWFPYFVTVVYIYLSNTADFSLAYESAFTMAVANSCMNPVIYAWKSRNYRRAFCRMLRCRSPATVDDEHRAADFVTDYVPRRPHETGRKKGGDDGDVTVVTCIDGTV